MTTREQIAVRIAEWDRQQVLRDVSYQKSADEILDIAIQSPEAREYWANVFKMKDGSNSDSDDINMEAYEDFLAIEADMADARKEERQRCVDIAKDQRLNYPSTNKLTSSYQYQKGVNTVVKALEAQSE